MGILYILYTTFTSVLFVLLLPAFWIYSRVTGRYAKHFRERLGFLSPGTVRNLSGAPRIWVHAVSLGEIKVAASIINALKSLMPNCAPIVSTITESGRELAEDTFGTEGFANLLVDSIRDLLVRIADQKRGSHLMGKQHGHVRCPQIERGHRDPVLP